MIKAHNWADAHHHRSGDKRMCRVGPLTFSNAVASDTLNVRGMAEHQKYRKGKKISRQSAVTGKPQ